jgi:hypothetical protein
MKGLRKWTGIGEPGNDSLLMPATIDSELKRRSNLTGRCAN